MYIDRRHLLARLLVMIGLVFTPPLYAQGYSIAPVSDWVIPVEAATGDPVDVQSSSNGVIYLLVDQQWRIDNGRQSRFRHFITRAVNSSGVEEESQISINFDPVYESLILHQIEIHRDGHVIDRLDRSRISLIQREKDLEYLIYDGSKTLNIFIEDVRPGDSIEFSYTLVGANPVFSGHFSDILKMRWSVPVGRVHYRLIWPASRTLYVREHATDIAPITKTTGEYTEYVWRLENVEALISDKDIPDWHDPTPKVYLSDFASWNEVAEWAWPMYLSATNTPAQNVITDPIMETADTDEQRVLAALRFVQDEVRYLGIEMGTRSHRPNDPDSVITQRFGDCKDKSRLLVSLLQGMNIEASAALVNTSGDLRVKKPLPTPTVFNHAIVVARVDGKSYWLDPTRNYQSGNLDTIYQPDYDYALVISEHGTGLTKMSDDITAIHSKVVEETFDIRDAVDNPATYQIQTHHEGYYADKIREELSETSINQVQQSYLNYMAHYYQDIQFTDRIRVDDDETLNKLALTEQYNVMNIWKKSEDDKRYVVADFEPYLINDQIKSVATPKRTMPYAVTHPVRYGHTTRILVPEGFSFENESKVIEDKAFRFTRKVSFSDDVLMIDYLYESLSDNVIAEDIQDYANNIRELKKLSYYGIQMPDPSINNGQYIFSAGDVNWPLVALLLLAFAGITFASYKYIYLYDPPYKSPDHVNTRLEGLAGWLILPGLWLIATPIRIAIESREFWSMFSTLQWSVLEEQLGTELMIIIVFEMLFNMTMIVTALFLIVIFFARRQTLPHLFIAYFAFMLTGFGADLLVLHLASFPGVEVNSSDIAELLYLAAYAAFWSLYFVKSERVKATFTRPRKRNELRDNSAAVETDGINNSQVELLTQPVVKTA